MLKPSRYNVSVEEAGATILYNTRTATLALADEATLAALEDPETSPALAQQLAAAGFLVDEAIDELELVKDGYRALQRDTSSLGLLIATTYACNLKCPYCYEDGHESRNVLLDEDTQDKIMDFVEEIYAKHPFTRLDVQWYGGEPTLNLAAIEALSEMFVEFCEEHGIAYNPFMISNATLIDEDAAKLLSKCRINFVLVTVDGPREMHNARRPARDGSDSYDATMEGIANLLAQGIEVEVFMNVDHRNYDDFDELNADLMERFGIQAKRALLNDYYRSFGTGDFRKPAFDLIPHREFALRQCEQFCTEHHNDAEHATLLSPDGLFCRGQSENYFAIDALGDVYKCDGKMGRPEYALFNLSDRDAYAEAESTAPAYPLEDAMCLDCQLLPICKGTCEWERMSCADHPCHPLKHTMDDYLRSWVKSISSVPESPDGLAVLFQR